MDLHAVPPEAAWSFLWGKRRWRRHTVDLDAELRWKQGRLPARTTNLSMGGAMLEVLRVHVTAALDRLGRAPTHKLNTVFEPPFLVRFGGGRVHAPADMLRIAWRPDAPDLLHLACRFRTPLTPDEVRDLGLEPRTCTAENGVLALPADRMPLQVNVHTNARLEVFRRTKDGGPDETRPLFAGPVVAMNRCALAFRLSAADGTKVVGELSSHPFDARVVVRDRVLWRGEAWLLGVRMLEGADLEVVVYATEPSESLRRIFHGRTKAFAS